MYQSPDPISNIAAHLPAMARQQPEAVALHLPQRSSGTLSYRQVSFAELEAASDRRANALQQYGIGRGMRTALMVPPGFEFFALTFALFKLGAVPVLIDPGLGVKNLKACLAEAQPEAFIGIPKAHVARLLFGWGQGSLKRLVTVGRRYWGGASLESLLAAVPSGTPFAMAATTAEETAAILFTSGSTSIPKGAVYSHGNFCAQVELLKEVYGIRPGEIDLPTFPLFALFAPALGMSAVIPEMDFTRPGSVDAEKLCTAINRFQITTMFGSPALIRRVADYGVAHKVKLPSLKRAISAGAPVPAAVLERFATLLSPQAQIFTPYGATEALPVCSIGSREILSETGARTALGEGVCIGRPVPGVEVAIVPISDEPLHFWNESYRCGNDTIGEIVVRGPQVTRRYYNRPASTDLAKILDPVSGTFWHRMGDLGYRDEAGRIWFCGRKSHRVMTRSGELYTIPCEGIFNAHPQVLRTALVGVGPAGAQTPVLCVELKAKARREEQARLRAELLELGSRHEFTRPIRSILFHPAFPVDIRHNAKIFREKLAVWAAGRVR
jgi:acyl-CoA synthetase (AMP-forming)/AMP-acid ligase II